MHCYHNLLLKGCLLFVFGMVAFLYYLLQPLVNPKNIYSATKIKFLLLHIMANHFLCIFLNQTKGENSESKFKQKCVPHKDNFCMVAKD